MLALIAPVHAIHAALDFLCRFTATIADATPAMVTVQWHVNHATVLTLIGSGRVLRAERRLFAGML